MVAPLASANRKYRQLFAGRTGVYRDELHTVFAFQPPPAGQNLVPPGYGARAEFGQSGR